MNEDIKIDENECSKSIIDNSPLIRLGEAIDNGEFHGIVSKYKCDKCLRLAKWETYIGLPAIKIPCGNNCDGYLVLQHDNQHEILDDK